MIALSNIKTFATTARNGLFLAAFSVATVGCATTEAPEPTHYWESSNSATSNAYRNDNSQCADLTKITPTAPMAASTDSFDAYRACMIERGYVLRTY